MPVTNDSGGVICSVFVASSSSSGRLECLNLEGWKMMILHSSHLKHRLFGKHHDHTRGSHLSQTRHPVDI